MTAQCQACGGSGKRATALSSEGGELERHERFGTRCDVCKGSGIQPLCGERRTALVACHLLLGHAGPHYGGRGCDFCGQGFDLLEVPATNDSGGLAHVGCLVDFEYDGQRDAHGQGV